MGWDVPEIELTEQEAGGVKKVNAAAKSFGGVMRDWLKEKLKKLPSGIKWVLSKMGWDVDAPTEEEKASNQEFLDAGNKAKQTRLAKEATAKQSETVSQVNVPEAVKNVVKSASTDNTDKELKLKQKSESLKNKKIETPTKNVPTINVSANKEDKVYPMNDGVVLARGDGILDIELKAIKNGLDVLNATFKEKLDAMDKVFNQILGVNNQQLAILPSLASKPSSSPPNYNSEVRDPVYEYRKEVYRSIRS